MYLLKQRELESMNILERIKKGEITQSEAAQLLKISERQVRRRLKNYRKSGANSLAHKHRGKNSNRKISDAIVTKILSLLKEKYLLLRDNPGPTFLADQLAKTDSININHETLRRLMISEGLWTVSKRKKARQHQWRERKHHFGEMVQIDGSLHIWFGDEYATLVAFIDQYFRQI